MSKFNFDSEFFRRIISSCEKTEKILPLSVMVRTAVDMFYDQYDYYPELTVFAPGTFTIFGDHLDYVKGNLVQAALPMGTIIVGKSLYCVKCKIVTSTKAFRGPKKSVFPITHQKNLKVFPEWVNFIIGVINVFNYRDLRGFDAIVHSNVPIKMGCGSSAALQVGFYTFLESVVCQNSCKRKKGFLCHVAEKESRRNEPKLGSWSNITSSIAKANTCVRIDCRTGSIATFDMKDINILFLLTYPKFEIERNDRELVPRRKAELHLAAKLLGLDDIIDATEEHLNVLANMEDPTRGTVITILQGLELSESCINQIVEDLFYSPKTPTHSIPEEYTYHEELIEEVAEMYEEDFEGPEVTIAQDPCNAPDENRTKLSKSAPLSYIQQRIAEACAGGLGTPMTLPQRPCEEINCLGGIENLSVASELTVCGKLLRRVRHIVTENMRSLSLNDVMTALDYEEFGTKLIQSHLSLKLDYDVSCPTLDTLVQLAIDSERVYGAKMTSGGGTLTLLHRSVVEEFIEKVKEKFGEKQFQFYLVFPSSGARILNLGVKNNQKSTLSNAFLTRDQVFRRAIQNFEATYSYRPCQGAYAPAVVDLIGDLTDAYHGLTLSVAINMNTVIVGALNGTGKIRVATTCDVGNESQKTIFLTPDTGDIRPGNIKWAKLIKGIVALFKGTVRGFDCLIQTSIPVSSGLLSKSSLAMAMYTFLEELSGEKKIPVEEKAYNCMLAMHEYCGLLFGVAEQLVIARCKENFFVAVDTRSLATTLVPFEDPSIALLLTCTDIPVQSQRAAFYSRLEECYHLAAMFGKKTLRCLTVQELNNLIERSKKKIPERTIRRAMYVLTENERVLKAAEALKSCDFETFGQLIVASHKSLRDDFEVVAPDMDQLVLAALEVDGVFGSKTLCSGLLNCTISLVKQWAVDDLIEQLKTATCQNLDFYVVNTSSPCNSFKLDEFLEKLPSPQFAFESLFPY